jgi:hypothetical protein
MTNKAASRHGRRFACDNANPYNKIEWRPHSKLILKVTNVTLWAIFKVQPGQTIEATISWQDDDNITVVESTLKETRDKKWKRQK